MFVHRVVPENTHKNTSHAENSELFVNIFLTRGKIFDWLRNIIASILRENVLVYLSLNIICSSKLISFLSSIYFVLWFLNVFDGERWYLWKISINLKQKIEKKLISLFLFTVLFSHSPFPIPAVSDSLIVSQNNKKIAWCTSALLLLVVQYSDESEGRVSKQTTIKNIQRCYTLKRLISYVLIQP